MGGEVIKVGRAVMRAARPVSGVPFWTQRDIVASGLTTAPSKLMRTKLADASRIAVGDQHAWPLKVIDDRARELKLGSVPYAGETQFYSLKDVRAQRQMDQHAFELATSSGTIPTLLMQRGGSGRLTAMVPKSGAGIADASRGAATLGRSSRSGVAPPIAPAQATTARKHLGLTTRQWAGGLTLGGIGAGVFFATSARPAPSAPSAAHGVDKAAVDAKAPAASPSKHDAGTVAPVQQPSEHDALAARISRTAIDEVGTKEDPGTGTQTGRVAKYYSTTTVAPPSREWDWPGYFAAWVRQDAGAPIHPAGGKWERIAELQQHVKDAGQWAAPTGHTPAAGEVVFFKEGDANRAAIVTGVTGDHVKTVQGWMPVGGTRAVAESTIALTDPAIVGYAIVPG